MKSQSAKQIKYMYMTMLIISAYNNGKGIKKEKKGEKKPIVKTKNYNFI